ncbi:MAG TPA: TadE family protein [Terriglobales bacterium]|nr:TadE family protein [Terriglobales bacterium]
MAEKNTTTETGSQILELALVLPILFLVIFAIFWFGLAYYITSTGERAAKQAIQIADRPTCATCGNTFNTDTQVTDSIKSVLQVGHLNPANLTSVSPPFACAADPAPSCRTLQGVEICSDVPLTCGSAACQQPPAACGRDTAFGTRISFAYRLDFPLAVGGERSLTIPLSAQGIPQR